MSRKYIIIITNVKKKKNKKSKKALLKKSFPVEKNSSHSVHLKKFSTRSGLGLVGASQFQKRSNKKK